MLIQALSIKQPWAWLIVRGYKDVENRTWWTAFRGPFLVHAGKSIDLEAYDMLVRNGWPLPNVEELDRGGIVGKSRVVDCVRQHKSKWFTGPYCLLLADSSILPFKPLRGMPGFWRVEYP
jgi:hypothetical protein